MKKVLGLALLLLLASSAWTLAHARDRYRGYRPFGRGVEVYVQTPYGGGFFSKGFRYAPGYVYHDHHPRKHYKHWRKHHHKKFKKRFRRGYGPPHYHKHSHRHCGRPYHY